MSDFFLRLVNMSIAAGWLVLAVVVLRLLLRRAPKWIAVLLWGIVAVRLLCPFTIESALSLIPSAETVSPTIMTQREPQIETGVPILNSAVNPIITEAFAPEPMTSANPLQILIPVAAQLWLVGVVALLVYMAVSFLRVRKQVATAVLLRDNIYQSERVTSPFVLGLRHPRIYLPFAMDERDMAHVIAHEKAHIRRHDHWWKPLGFLLLTVYWFNPLMWLGYVLLCRDIELACDEKVVSELGAEQKADYSQALLTCSVSRRTVAACPLAFGEVGVKGRIKSVLNYKQPAFWIIAAAIVACAAVAVCFLTSPVGSASTTLGRIEDGRGLPIITVDSVAVMASSDGENYEYVGAVEQSVLRELYALRISKKEISLDRGEDRDKRHTLALNIPTDDGPRLSSYIGGTLVHFNKSFTAVWVDDGVKPTLSYAVRNPQKARALYTSIVGDGSAVTDVDGSVLESTLSFANWAEANEIYTNALNSDKLMYKDVPHLPIFKFDTAAELQQFKKDYSEIFTMDGDWDEVPSFNAATARYGDEFFAENTLLLVYVGVDNSTHRFRAQSMEHSDTYLCLHIEETTGAESVDTAMAGWFVTVAVEDTLVKNVTVFDADINNAIDVTLPRFEGTLIPDSPPEMVVVANDISLVAQRSTSDWTYLNEDGQSVTVCSDGSHPTAMFERLPVLDLLGGDLILLYGTDPLTARIQFNAHGVEPIYTVPPDELYVGCWQVRDDGQYTIVEEETIETRKVNGNVYFTLKEGDYIYEVHAKWHDTRPYSGTATYAFRARQYEAKQGE